MAMPGKLGRNVKRRPNPTHGGALPLPKFARYRDSWQKCDTHGSRNALFDGLYARELGDVSWADLLIREDPIEF